MAKKSKTESAKQRVKVKELPQQKKELSGDDQKKIKGGNWLMTPAGSAKPGGNPGGN